MAECVAQPCKWELCTTKCSSDQALYEHLLKDHTAPWRKPGVEKLACGWADCKTEPHRRWLTQHLISHTEHRPFVCGVSTCSQGYKTRFTLEKHIKDRHSNLKHVELPAQTSESLASTTSSTPVTPPKKYSLARAPLKVQVTCQWNNCGEKFADPPTLLTHLLTSHLPRWFNSKPVNYELPQTFLTTTNMPADLFVAATGPGTKKRKSKGDGEEGDAKRRRVGLEHDESDDDEPLATQLRALLVTEPDGDEDDIAYSDDVKDTDYSPTKEADAEDEEMYIASEDEDEDDIEYAPSPSLNLSSKERSVTASSTAVVTPEHEQEQDASEPIATGPTVPVERLAAVKLHVKTLEQKLDAALNVIRQSKVLRAEWIDRESESTDAGELEEEWNAGIDIVKTLDADEDEPDDWSLWVMGAL